MRCPLLAIVLCLLPTSVSRAGDSDDARTRHLLERVVLRDGGIEGPVTVANRPLATVALDLSARDESLTIPVTWTGGVDPQGFAAQGPLTASTTGIFGGNDLTLAIDLTAVPERPLEVRCRVVGSGVADLPQTVVCGIGAPLFASAAEALNYLSDPAVRPTRMRCDCDPGDGEIWTLTFPVAPGDPSVLTTPAGEVLTLARQGNRTSVSMIGGEMSHSLRFTMDFEGARMLRMDAVLQGPGPIEETAGGKSAAPATLGGRLWNASATGPLRCEVFDPPAPADPSTFPSADRETPSWQGTLSCRATAP
jgi:hypothetical protein